MKCPICGAKLVGKELCKYCKVTRDQIENASNAKVKEYRKRGDKDLIYFTNVIPDDINKIYLLLYAIFFGWCGAHHFYVKRYIRGGYSCINSILAFVWAILKVAIEVHSDIGIKIFDYSFQIIYLSMAINVVLWGFDVINIIFHTFKVPVVLGKKGEKK